MLSVAEARARVLARARHRASESIPLAEARGRYLAEDTFASVALPSFDQSAMDGFAVRTAELPGVLPIADTIAAGDAPGAVLSPGTTQRVMTGAPLPAGADAVVIREEVHDRGHEAEFAATAEIGAHIRRSGEDLQTGAVAVSRGICLGAGELGLLAALGKTVAPVRQRPRVAVVSTGDELVPLGQTPRPGQKVDSNSVALAALIEDAGAELRTATRARDDRASLEAALGDALLDCDVLITSGGVSAGDFDYVRDVLPALGIEVDFFKIAMKPGKPLVFGSTRAGLLYFGLPGNPVSSMVTFELFVRPALLKLAGADRVERARAPVRMAHGYDKNPGRTHFLRAQLRRDGDALIADASRAQGSGHLSSMVGVDALVEVPAEAGAIAAGHVLSAVILRLP